MLRKIKNSDIERIYELGSLYDFNFSKKYFLEDYVDNPIYILNCYEESNKVQGFIIASKLFETVEILLLYVDGKYRQKGIGTQLINSLIQNDIDDLLLEVSIENQSAINLYQKCGFDVISIRKKYYNGIDAYVMRKVLK